MLHLLSFLTVENEFREFYEHLLESLLKKTLPHANNSHFSFSSLTETASSSSSSFSSSSSSSLLSILSNLFSFDKIISQFERFKISSKVNGDKEEEYAESSRRELKEIAKSDENGDGKFEDDERREQLNGENMKILLSILLSLSLLKKRHRALFREGI